MSFREGKRWNFIPTLPQTWSDDLGSISLSLVICEIRLMIPDSFVTEQSQGVRKPAQRIQHVGGLLGPLNVVIWQ